ncbi:MAG: hypothetical protein U9R27_06800 [Campylobacterota bacterium]|nr:hypothetical protein [Campylobacterota bacterium]
MLHKNEEKIQEVRDITTEVMSDMLITQKLTLQALEDCDGKSYSQAKFPLKGITSRIDEIDQLIITIFTRYSPEARDLREMVAFLKITYSLQRIVANEKSYIKNMDICSPESDADIRDIIAESLAINKCTIKAIEYTMEMVNGTEDIDRLKDLSSKISVEASKTDDIYSLLEKDMLQSMNKEHMLKEEYVNLLRYIRKNLKIIYRLEDIAEKLLFAKIGSA